MFYSTLQAGYCQGLNFVASVLLLATGKNPETAFWLLVALITRILYPNMYAQWLPGFQVRALDTVCRMYLCSGTYTMWQIHHPCAMKEWLFM